MTDSFDAVILGGGHHATIIAPYLARAGLSVGVFESGARLGGAATSGPGPVKGFTMNHYAHWTRFYGHPAYRDFRLQDEGLRYVFPEGNEAMVFDDHTSFVGYSAFSVINDLGETERSDQGVAKTEQNIRRFSEKDADTYLRLLDAYTRHLKRAFARHRFTAPPPWGTPDALEELLAEPESLIEPVHQFMSVRQLAYDFFESDELRTLFMRAATTSTGCYPDDVMGLQGLVHVLGLTLSFEPAAIAVGGTGAITRALVAAGEKRGVQYFTHTQVDEIVQRNGRATGIRLVDGTTVTADIVVSDLGLPQTVLRLLRNTEVSDRIRRRVANIHFDRGQLLWANVASHEAPDYASTTGNPEVGRQPRLYWGPKDPDWLATRYQAEIMTRGLSSRLFTLTSTDSLWDAGRAPEGKHLTGVEEFTAPLRLFGRDDWKRIETEIEQNIRAQWPLYASNMTADNIISVRIGMPRDVLATHADLLEGGYSGGSHLASQLGRFRPVPELAGYQTVLPNVYTCSANVHSGSGIGRGSSYNCWKQIASDLSLDPDAEVRAPDAAPAPVPADTVEPAGVLS